MTHISREGEPRIWPVEGDAINIGRSKGMNHQAQLITNNSDSKRHEAQQNTKINRLSRRAKYIQEISGSCFFLNRRCDASDRHIHGAKCHHKEAADFANRQAPKTTVHR